MSATLSSPMHPLGHAMVPAAPWADRGRQWGRLLWKEVLEVRGFLYGGAAVLLVLPLIESVQWMWRPRAIQGSPFYMSTSLADTVHVLGAVFVMITAIGVVCRDVGSLRETFWRSSPLGAWRVAMAKFLVGLAGCLALIGVVLALQLVLIAATDFFVQQYPYSDGQRLNQVHGYRTTFQAILVHMPLLAMLYSLAFALAAWTGKAVSSAFFAAIAATLVYFAPLLWPALEPINVWSLFDRPTMWLYPPGHQPSFFSGATLLDLKIFGWSVVYHRQLPGWWGYTGLGTLIAGIAGILTLARGWRVGVGVMSLAWSLVVLGLGIFATVAVQIGSNLEAVHVVPLSDDPRWITVGAALNAQGDGLVLAAQTRPRWVSYDAEPLTAAAADADAPVLLNLRDAAKTDVAVIPNYSRQMCDVVLSPTTPGVAYALISPVRMEKSGNQTRWHSNGLILQRVRFGTGATTVTGELVLDEPDPEARSAGGSGQLMVVDGRLFATWHDTQSVLVEIDLAAEDLKIARRWEPEGYFYSSYDGQSGSWAGVQLHLNVPTLDSLTPEQVTAIRLAAAGTMEAVIPFDGGQHLAKFDSDTGLQTFVRQAGPGGGVDYASVGRRTLTPLERLFGAWPQAWAGRGRWVAVLVSGNERNVMLFDVADPTAPRKVGHYYAPGGDLQWIGFLDDDHLAVAGRSLHILAMPD